MYTWEDHERRMFRKLGLALQVDQSVLDVGCGDGTMSYLIAQQAGKVLGTDIQPNAAWWDLERSLSNLEFQIADACQLPFSNDRFDVVISKDLLHHVATPERAIAEMRRVAKEGALVIIVESNRYNPIKYVCLTKLRGPEEHFAKKQFKQLITSKFTSVDFSGFEDHYYPAKTRLGRHLLFTLDWVFEKTPVLNRFLGYNVAIAKK